MEKFDRGNIRNLFTTEIYVKENYSCKDARMNRSTVLSRVTARALSVGIATEKSGLFIVVIQRLLNYLSVTQGLIA